MHIPAFPTGYLGPSLTWSLLSEAMKHFLPLEGHRGNQQRKSRDSRPAHLHNPHCSLLFWSLAPDTLNHPERCCHVCVARETWHIVSRPLLKPTS